MRNDKRLSVFAAILAVIEEAPAAISKLARTQMVSAFTQKIETPRDGENTHFAGTNELRANSHIFWWGMRSEAAQ